MNDMNLEAPWVGNPPDHWETPELRELDDDEIIEIAREEGLHGPDLTDAGVEISPEIADFLADWWGELPDGSEGDWE